MLEGHHEPVWTGEKAIVHTQFSEAASPAVKSDNQSTAIVPVVQVDHSKRDRAKAVMASATNRQRRRPARVTLENANDTQPGTMDGSGSRQQNAVTQSCSSPQPWPSPLSARTDSAVSTSDGGVGIGCSGQESSGVCAGGGSEGGGGMGNSSGGVKGLNGVDLVLPLPSSPAGENGPGTGRIVYVHALESKIAPAFGTPAAKHDAQPVPTSALQEGSEQNDYSNAHKEEAEAKNDTAFFSLTDPGHRVHSAAENARLAGILRAALHAVAVSSKDCCDDSRSREEDTPVKANVLSSCSTPPVHVCWRGQCCLGYCCSCCSRCCGEKCRAATASTCLLQEKATQTEPEAASPAAAVASTAAASSIAAAAAAKALAKEKAKVII